MVEAEVWYPMCIMLQELVEDGPIPWATKNNVSCIAEQVSHHPPSES